MIIPWLGLLLGLSLPTGSRASRWSAHAGGGWRFPAGDASVQESLDPGWIATGALGFAASPGLHIVVRGTYSDSPRDDAGALRVAAIHKVPFRILEISGGTMSTWEALGELHWFLSPTAGIVQPYVLGAAGLSSYEYEGVDIAYAYAGHTWPAVIPGEQATATCLGAGGGVRFVSSPWLAFSIETRLHAILRGHDTLWSVPLWLEVAVSP